MESLFLLLQGSCYEGAYRVPGSPPGLASPAPATPRTYMQRLMFPIREFHQHFPFVTPAVTRQVEPPAMFPECVMMSALWARSALPGAATTGASHSVSYTHLRAHETRHDLVCRLLLEKK